LVCSLSLPILFSLARHSGWLKRGILLGGLITWSLYRDGRLSAWLFMFYLGFLLPAAGSTLMQVINRTRLARWFAPLSWILLCVSVDLFAGHKSWGRLLEGVSATVFISALLYGPELAWFRILDRALTRFYGRISYSFYLYHMVSLYFVSKTAFRLFPVSTLAQYAIVSGVLLLLFSTALATPLAWASHRFVEKSGIDFSKKLCRLITDQFLGAHTAV
jgi:peptidoglycan/LPS O-acetylase OafA/YrhL